MKSRESIGHEQDPASLLLDDTGRSDHQGFIHTSIVREGSEELRLRNAVDRASV